MSDRDQVNMENTLSTGSGKRRWVSPTIEEMDFRAASFGSGAYLAGDVNTYKS